MILYTDLKVFQRVEIVVEYLLFMVMILFISSILSFLSPQGADVTCHFLRHGSHYGAFGAALNRSLKFLKTPSLTPASGESEKVEDSEPDEQNTHL